MREFTPEEKELIVNTPITLECFGISIDFLSELIGENQNPPAWGDNGFKLEVGKWKNYKSIFWHWIDVQTACESLRKKYLEEKDEKYFTELVRLLPNSYKVVKL